MNSTELKLGKKRLSAPSAQPIGSAARPGRTQACVQRVPQPAPMPLARPNALPAPTHIGPVRIAYVPPRPRTPVLPAHPCACRVTQCPYRARLLRPARPCNVRPARPCLRLRQSLYPANAQLGNSLFQVLLLFFISFFFFFFLFFFISFSIWKVHKKNYFFFHFPVHQ